MWFVISVTKQYRTAKYRGKNSTQEIYGINSCSRGKRGLSREFCATLLVSIFWVVCHYLSSFCLFLPILNVAFLSTRIQCKCFLLIYIEFDATQMQRLRRALTSVCAVSFLKVCREPSFLLLTQEKFILKQIQYRTSHAQTEKNYKLIYTSKRSRSSIKQAKHWTTLCSTATTTTRNSY